MGLYAFALATLVGGSAKGPDGECEGGVCAGGVGVASGVGGKELHMFNLTREPPAWRVDNYRWVSDPVIP